MPTYEYQCTVCRNAFEKFQPITSKPLRTCPMCGKALRRLIGPGGGVIFKGSGFYETDYKHKNRAKPAESAESGEKPAAQKTEEKPPKKSDDSNP